MNVMSERGYVGGPNVRLAKIRRTIRIVDRIDRAIERQARSSRHGGIS